MTFTNTSSRAKQPDESFAMLNRFYEIKAALLVSVDELMHFGINTLYQA